MSDDDVWYLVPERQLPSDAADGDEDGLLVDLSRGASGRAVRPGPFQLPRRMVGRRGKVRDKT